MKRIKFIKCRGHKVLKLDFSWLADEKTEMELIEKARKFIRRQPKNSLLVFTDVTGSKYTKRVAAEITEFVKNNAPYVKAGAVLGMAGITLMLFKAIVKYSGRKNTKAFTKAEKAEKWLVGCVRKKNPAKRKAKKPRKKAKKKIRPAALLL